MKKVLALVLALVLCLGMTLAQAEAAPVKVGILVPAVTHGWVGGITYNAEQYAKELEAAGKIEYKLFTSSNAEEMTTQIDEVMLWGAQALVIAPQWTGMEVAAQGAIDAGLTVVAFDMDIPAEGIYKVTGDNESMGVAGAKQQRMHSHSSLQRKMVIQLTLVILMPLSNGMRQKKLYLHPIM